MNNEQNMNQQIALFYFGYKAFTETADLIIAKHSLKRLYHRILFFTARMPGLTINELLTFLEISKQALHQPLAELKERELLTIEQGRRDKRQRCIFLTTAGKELENELGAAQRKQMAEIFANSSDTDGLHFTEVMEGYAKNRPGAALIKDFKE
ncbi:MarR family transcriptional regulator [Listeria monocytogenes]|nr:MarR family transcriptional regulator [Listeria monocytogenes]EAF5181051.1 MarR family transcriptional regulator [Listeria monocytogenes]EEO9064874.1 MarR family transcriptional regulator [Listeria monocytogenes]